MDGRDKMLTSWLVVERDPSNLCPGKGQGAGWMGRRGGGGYGMASYDTIMLLLSQGI